MKLSDLRSVVEATEATAQLRRIVLAVLDEHERLRNAALIDGDQSFSDGVIYAIGGIADAMVKQVKA